MRLIHTCAVLSLFATFTPSLAAVTTKASDANGKTYDYIVVRSVIIY